MRFVHCPTCARNQLAEFVDPHGDLGAADYACTVCGTALAIDPILRRSDRPIRHAA